MISDDELHARSCASIYLISKRGKKGSWHFVRKHKAKPGRAWPSELITPITRYVLYPAQRRDCDSFYIKCAYGITCRAAPAQRLMRTHTENRLQQIGES